MAINTRHHTEHQFHGEASGVPVAEFLNRSTGTPEHRRIEELIDMLRRAPTDSRAAQRLQWRLSRYPMRLVSSVKNGRLSLTWAAYKNAAGGESAIAHQVIQLSQLGLLQSLRQCENEHPNGQWFFARFAHQRFCSTDCRIRFNASSEHAKKYRREKQREYYQFKKTHPRKGVRR